MGGSQSLKNSECRELDHEINRVHKIVDGCIVDSWPVGVFFLRFCPLPPPNTNVIPFDWCLRELFACPLPGI